MNFKIALIGMMGSGKTTVAKELSQKTNCPLFDCDSIFEHENKIKITDFFKQYGEEKFRICENIVLNNIIKNENFIISTGGGIILNKKNRDILFKGNIKTFYLKASAETIFKRLKNDKTRPLLQVFNPLDEIKNLINKREVFYNCADYIIDCENKKIDTIAEEILSKYGKN